MRHAWSSVLGAALILLGLCLGLHAVRACVSSLIYHNARYGGGACTTESLLTQCERAHAWYRHNHALSIWAGEHAYYHRYDDSDLETPGRVEAAFKWGRRAVALNPWSPQARMLEVNRLARNSLPEAIRYWEEYVDWQYWSPHNHLPLVDLYARAGMFDLALRKVQFLRGTECEPQARRLVTHWWDRERQAMKELSDRQTQRLPR